MTTAFTWTVNMRMAPRRWTSEPWQFVIFPNPSYLNSLWLGVFWNLFLLPHRIWVEVIDTILHGEIVIGLMLMVMLPISVVRLFIFGLLGRVSTFHMTIEDSCITKFMTPEEADQDLKSGTGVLRRAVF